jgi:hypothetical protein
LSSIGNSISIGSGSGARIAAGARRTAAGRDGRRAGFLLARFAAAFRFGAAFLRRAGAFFFLDVFIFRLLALLLLFVFFRFLAMNASRLNSRVF